MSQGSVVSGADWHPLLRAYSDAIPTVEALDLVAAQAPIIEVGAGNGYWARLLADRGCDIIATDREPPAESRLWTTLQRADGLEAVRQYPDRVLFSCWPPRPDGYLRKVLPAYSGSTFLIITEPRHDPYWIEHDSLYDHLAELWVLDESLDLPHWPGRHDSLMIWRR